MPDAEKDQAIVIAGQDLGESDRLITLFTALNGKVRAVAKGAKRSRKRFANALEPFTRLDLVLVPPRNGTGFFRIDSAEIKGCFPIILEDVQRFFLASLCCELVDKWTRDADPHLELYRLLAWIFEEIARPGDARRAVLAFQARLLGHAGYAPAWTRCSLCGNEIRGPAAQMRLDKGGFACARCAPGDGFVSMGALKGLEFLQQCPLVHVSRLRITDSQLAESWSIVRALHRHHLGEDVFSYGLIACPTKTPHAAAPA